MIDYDSLKPGDQVLVDLYQSRGHFFPGVVQTPVQWKSKKKAVGRIGVQVAHHADPVRGLVVHSRHGVSRGYDELHAYTPVPVEAASRIARDYKKAVVVIVCWDKMFNQVHTTTYGVTPGEKEVAARLGEILSTAASADNSKAVRFDDFRFKTQAEWAAEREKMVQRIAELEKKGAGS